MSFMDRTCQADFMPELLQVDGRREWEFGFGLCALLPTTWYLTCRHPPRPDGEGGS